MGREQAPDPTTAGKCSTRLESRAEQSELWRYRSVGQPHGIGATTTRSRKARLVGEAPRITRVPVLIWAVADEGGLTQREVRNIVSTSILDRPNHSAAGEI